MENQGGSRRLMKLLTIVGGLAALLWAMRDRFISIPTEREKIPPSFRASNGESPK
ncbi:MAG: hypothetical protein ACRDVK_11185 [Acidimicrobiia bacterium]